MGIISRPRKALGQQVGCKPVAEMTNCIWGCVMRSPGSKSWQEIMPLTFAWNFMNLACVHFSSLFQSPSRWHHFPQAHEVYHSAWCHLCYLFFCNWSFVVSLCYSRSVVVFPKFCKVIFRFKQHKLLILIQISQNHRLFTDPGILLKFSELLLFFFWINNTFHK